MISKKIKIYFALIFLSTSALLSAQRANVLATYQLVENGKFDEAKKAIEDAILDEKTSKWSRTWYARGFLCQEAYAKGVKDKKQEYCEIYPDQLYVAFDSYQKALSLEQGEKIKEQLEPRYVSLANDFIKLGADAYKNKKYKESLKAYEHAILLSKSEVLSRTPDTTLVYNTALAAYKSQDREKSLKYLNQLNKMNFSSNVSHLLYVTHMESGDTLSAKKILNEGIKKYDDNEDLVLILVDLLYNSREAEEAIKVLESVNSRDKSKYTFTFTKGLVYQKAEQYTNAINAYKEAARIDSSKFDPLLNIGICYFNIGVEIEANARNISNNREFQQEQAKAVEARKSAVSWLEKALEKDSQNIKVRDLLAQLYQALHLTDKLNALE